MTIHLTETASTSIYLREMLRQAPKPEEMTIVYCDCQTNGYGQRGNSWESENGKNVTMSILLYPDITTDHSFSLMQAIALAIKDTVNNHGIPCVKIKWPNDIYIADKKICGFINEQSVSGRIISDCICGIGLNVNQTTFLSDAPNPTSMKLITSKSFNIEEVIDSLRVNIAKRYNSVLNSEFHALKTEYIANLHLYAEPHTYTDVLTGDSFLGQITDVCNDGRLEITDNKGDIKRYAFKEVKF